MSANDTTIFKAQTERLELERKIGFMLREMEEKTGVRITRVDVIRSEDTDKISRFYITATV